MKRLIELNNILIFNLFLKEEKFILLMFILKKLEKYFCFKFNLFFN